MSMTLAERLAQDRRRLLLELLQQVEGHGLNEDMLVRELTRLRLGVVTRDDMRGLISWLERQGLVEIEKLQDERRPGGELWLAQATRQGRDVARGARHPGVADPL